MTRRVFSLIAYMKTLFSLWLGLAGALALGAVEPLSWARCLEIAERANPELQAARKALDAWENNVRNSAGAFLPTLNGALGYQRTQSLPGIAGPADGYGYSATLSAGQNFFNGFADKARLDETRAKRERAEADLAATRARLSFELKSAFANTVYAQSAISLLKAIEERRESNTKIIALRYQNGSENYGSVMLAEAQLEQARLDHAQALLNLSSAQADLARVLGFDHPEQVSVVGEVPTNSPPIAPDFAGLAKVLPEYRKSVASEHEAEALLTLSRSSFFPTFAVSAGIGSGGSRFFPNENGQVTVGASLVIPLFNGTRDFWGVLSASDSHTAAVLRRENELRGGLTRLRDAYNAFSVASRKVDIDKKLLEAATVRSRIAREKYNNGLMTFEDWDVIENEYIAKQKDYLQSRRTRIVAEAAWEQAQGKGTWR